MEKFIKLIVFALLMYSITSCENYLNTESYSTFTEETVFTNLDFATKAVNGIYANLTSANLYATTLIFFGCDNDIEFSIAKDDGSRNSSAHYAATEGSSAVKAVWNTLYQTIERANICIDNLPVSPIWNGEYTKQAHQLYGEAVTMRAWCYYELIHIWGDVPFILKSTQAGDNYYLPKTDRDSIYEYLIQDLADVEQYVFWMSETQSTEKVNKAFVKGLRARMALAYAGYSLRNKTFETRHGRYRDEYYKIANKECREIIESSKHQLNPSFMNIFKTLHAYSQDLVYKESLFEVAFGRLYSGRWCNTIGMPFCSSPAEPKYGRADPFIFTSPYYYYSFDKADQRRNVSVELYNYINAKYLSQQRLVSSTSFALTKWRKTWITPSMGGDYKAALNTGVNCPLMRYADIILMFAETENEINNGPTQAAKDALSLIRQRSFPQASWVDKVTNYVDSVSVNKDAFFNAIVDERAWEFGGELIRKYDLVRWNLLGPKITEMKAECQKIIRNDPKYANIPTYIFWKYKDDNETLDILNPDYRLPSTPISGYTVTSWLPLMSASSITGFTTTMDLIAHGYNVAKNNHLLPIHGDIIVASNGILSNDQIP